jgi:hypothetical protein
VGLAGLSRRARGRRRARIEHDQRRRTSRNPQPGQVRLVATIESSIVDDAREEDESSARLISLAHP